MIARNFEVVQTQIPAFDVTRQDLLQILRKIEYREAFSTAEKCRTWFNQPFR